LEIQRTQAIPLRFFHIWQGLVTLCAATDINRCGQLMYSGIFDAALATRDKQGFSNLDAAMDYCQKILRPGGLCDNVLPVTFIMYRQQVMEKCGTPHYSHGMDYVSPANDHDVMHLVNVEYEKIGQFDMASGWKFRFFLGLILLVWYVNLLGELEAVILLADFLWNFPVEASDPFRTQMFLSRMRELSATMLGPEPDHPRRSPARTHTHLPTHGRGGSRPLRMDSKASSREFLNEDGLIEIKAISRLHKVTIAIMVLVRFTLIVYMAGVGTIFILTTYSYPDLLMNAVALAFVFELPEFFYSLLVGHQEKEQLESIAPLEFQSSLPKAEGGLLGFIASKYFLGLFLFPVLAWALVEWNHRHNIAPVSEALQCVCFQSGPRCSTRQFMDRTWWNRHWADVAWSFGK
jgi:hypothetical protein